jgi:cytochrome P450
MTLRLQPTQLSCGHRKADPNLEPSALPRDEGAVRTATWYSDVAAALVDRNLVPDVSAADRFSGQTVDVTQFLGLSGREHAVRRAAVSRHLTGPAVRRREPLMALVADDLISDLPAGETVEIGASFARPLAARCVIELLGIETENVGVIISLAHQTMDLTRSHRRRVLASARMFKLAKGAVNRARQEERAVSSGDLGLIPVLTRSTPIDQDIFGVIMPLLTVGVELTARAVLACLAHQGEAGVRLDLSDAVLDSAIAQARIVPTTDRLARCPTHIGEMRVSADERVRLDLVSHRVDGAARPLPFGLGEHYCLGAAWTHSVARVAASTLHAAFPKTRVVDMAVSEQPPGGPITLDLFLGR